MIVKVCDAIMGTGKSQSAITYMNEHKDDRFIYITPYLEEANRIKKGCSSLRFVEPQVLAQYNLRKTEHAAALIREGRNITTTHQAFKGYTPETLEDIKSQGYTLIIDENVDVLETFDFHVDDLQIAVDAGYIKEDNGIYTVTNTEYKGKALRDMFRLLKTRELVRIEDDDSNSLFYWALPPELITSFKNVFILTYLFKGQSLHHFLEIYNIPYEYIGIEKTDEAATGFRFAEYPGYTPEYVSHLGDMLHVIESGRINDIGDDYFALSMNWFKKSDEEETDRLRRNVANCFKNIWSDIPADERLWATYNKEKAHMQGKGYTKSFLTFNAKATNAYRNRTHLVYMVNVFMNVNDKKFYQKHGIEVDEDLFALSIMVQWIWRSAIRDGEEVYLYIPSSRMRNILINWINTVSKGGNIVE